MLLKQFNLDAIYLSEMIKQLAFRVYCAMKTLSMLMVCKNGCGISNSICTSVSTGRDVPLSLCPFVPGQRIFLVPMSLCPGTRAAANVPGRPGTKCIKNFQKNDQNSCFWTSFSCFRTSFSCYRTSLSALSRCLSKSRTVLSHVLSRILTCFPGPSHPLVRF